MNQVRVRFAPSPTGYLHVGGLRTALYNYLFAKKNQGKFILRIEDTDQTRYVPGAVENLIRTLNLCGLEYDEGPDKEGPFGPYIQSQRLDLYRKYTMELVEKGFAYPCFCSQERLEAMRARQTERGETPRYDGTCRNLDPQTAKSRMEIEEYVIRMKMPLDGETVFTDLIRGEIRMPNEMSDDQILIKSDGFPTYHLANVVDDHLMQISHVIRGEEWLPSVPKHITLYRMFGWTPPQFAHLPLLLNPDRSKLSKRQGDVAVEDYLKKGFLPQALINFVALLGWNPGNDQEIFTMDELINQFSLERVNKAGAVFDVQKLKWMNGVYIRNLSDEEYISFAQSFLDGEKKGLIDNEKLKLILLSVKNKIEIGSEIPEKTAIFFAETVEIQGQESREILFSESSRKILPLLQEKLSRIEEVNLNNFQALMKEIQKETGLKGKDLWMPVRVALTGTDKGPELPVIIQVFGKEKIVNILNKMIGLLS